MAAHSLIHGGLHNGCIHLCVDMQLLFAPGAPWAVPRSEKVVPVIARLASDKPHDTIFTRFIPADRPGEGPGTWARYYKRWASVTLANIEPRLIELVPALSQFVPPARIIDKRVYSPWTEGVLDQVLKDLSIHTLVITGAETDVCVLATVLGAVDRGLRVVLVTDAICSSADQTHEALMEVYRSRFSEQIEIAEMQEVLENWSPAAGKRAG